MAIAARGTEEEDRQASESRLALKKAGLDIPSRFRFFLIRWLRERSTADFKLPVGASLA
jgi:hypothetical protein